MRRLLIPLTLLGVAAFALMMTNVHDRHARGDDDFDLWARIGFHIAPLPLNVHGKNAKQVGYGSYLVNTIGDCNDCHSSRWFAPGGDPFMGQPKVIDKATYLRGGQAFGTVISRNIRPEFGSGLPAGLTIDEFLAVMRHGTDFDNSGQLLKVMPWSSYQYMSKSDIIAIYAYLSSLPPVPAGG